MTFDITTIALIGIAYLLLLFGVAYVAERGWISHRVLHHPITYIMSLGIFASAWSFYGVIDLAFQFGYGALAYYLGTGALFLFAPVAIAPLAQLARRFQIGSLADLLVFRYHSQAAGSLVTAGMVMACLPLLALQIQAVADTLQIITINSTEELPDALNDWSFREVMALAYCVLLALFTVLFGSGRDQHPGLVVAMALESLIKVVALMAIGLLAVYGVFGGLDELDQWLLDYPENLELLHQPIHDTASHTLLLVFLATAISMPHIFHMSVVENPLHKTTATLSWAFPLFLLFLALPIFPILWAGFELGVNLPAQYFTLGIPMQMNSPGFTLLAFLGGVAAATGAMVALCLALSTMLLNYWLLPATRLGRHNLYRQLLWSRRVLILLVFSAGYAFYQLLDNNYSLTHLALMAFIETLQFLPGIFAVAYWPTANSRGFIWGLCLGTLVWMVGLLLPTVFGIDHVTVPVLDKEIGLGIDYWNTITLMSLGLNVGAFVLLSLTTRTSEEERYSAELCAEDELSHPLRMILDVHSADEFATRLAKSLGEDSARKELKRALDDLNLNRNERRPYALRRLRDKLEANLSGLMGTAVASEILDRHIPYHLPEAKGTADINLIENRLTKYRSQLTGMAAELNNLRLYHRNTLEELPMAVCSLGQDLEILMWNQAMVALTDIPSETVIGSHLDDLKQPWRQLLEDFSRSPMPHLHKQQLDLGGRSHWISLHKANIASPVANSADGQVILLEDMTETQLLEQELVHSERLASVGRLAAGVAHEIGNPITGIACLAQNLKYETDDPEAAEDTAQQILSQTQRVSRIVQSLVSFSHTGQQDKIDFMTVSLRDCAEEAIALLSLQKDKTQVRFRNHIDTHLSVRADSQRLIQVFINLLSNARDASPEDSEVRLESSIEGHFAQFRVIDQGSGIPAEHQERVLEPFFTSKDPGEGTGLGLAMVYSIVEDHEGHLDILSPAPGQTLGTQISIKLPLNLESQHESGNTN
ncbi:histidine kinase [Pseudomaricurvus alkylphenolicus]|jgi:signal transduction histidine kinase/Na+/proline symporter|uniref:ATP-binding protein n=1 Tax=Pseudomaricurvus alkylphenolicus TaxID=1306991 RepID=UPI0014218004|nr:ATP-binding protein [Pseudomaricurvus alkylphenolicus]NIB42901.1 histidine kinase [Pseudomaricurvus alkylphenolicus]